MSSSSVFPLEIQELRRPGAVYRMDVKCFTSIKDIKDQLHKELKCPPSRMQLYHSVGSKRLANQSTLHDLGITQAGGVLYLSVLFSTNPQFMLLPAKDMCVDEYCEEMIGEVRLGLRSGHLPAKTDMLDCTGGVYFLKGGANTPVAVFKPSDEEQGMPNNPKGHAGNGDYGLRPYFRPGEGYLRETASYILDHGGFCGVPPTVIVHCEHDSFNYPFSQTGKKTVFPKLGSLQRFVPSSDTFEDIGHSLVGVLELQKIALLDMRLLNCDRNASNMLAIRKTQSARSARGYGRDAVPRKYSRSSSLGTASECYEEEREEISMDEFLDSEYQPSLHGHASRYSDQYALVPIDHGYCLPSHLQIDELDWAWFHCPHVAVEVQPEIREYINSLDIEALLEDLTSQVPVSEDCLYLLRVAHAVVKEGINAGLTLRDIAALIARTEEDVPSPLENAIAAAEDNAQRAMESRAGRRGTANSPSFAKAMLSCSAEGAAVNLNLLLPPRGHTNSMRVREVGSPEPVVIVKQRSVGSPRCAGAASPPQRIGAMKRVTPPSPSASPSDGSESDGCSLCSGADCAHMGKGGSSGPSSAKKNRGGSVIGSHQRVMPEDSRLSIALPDGGVPPALGAGAGTPLVRPFPLRGTPDRPRRVVSSELNLECLNRGSPPSVTAPPSLESGYSLSCDSRSPGPPRQEPFCSVGSRIRQQSGERVSIAYLSSENIQRLQGSPAVTASKFGDFLTKDTPTASSRARPESARGDQSPSCAGAGGEQSLGDYFMKDLTAPASTPGPTGPWSLRMELPPMGLVSSSSAAASPLCSRSPSSAFNAHQAGSKERITASVSTEKLSTGAAAAGSGLPRSVSSAQSLGSTGSASSRGEGNKRNGGLQGIGAAVRPKAGDALFKLQSFDDGSLLRQLHRAGPASAPNPLLSPSPPSLRPSAAVLPTACGAGSAEVATHAQLSQSQLPAMSSSLFASDSDFTSHSTGTSYESSWASESPKMSPKVSDKSRRSLAGDQVVGVVLQGLVERVEVPVRDDVRYSSRRAAELGGDIAAGSVCDGPVLFSMPLKGDESCGQSPARAVCSPDSADRECTSSVELGGTDTEGDFDEVLPLPPRGQGIVHSATKPKPSLSAQRGAAQPGTEPASPGASLAGLSMPMKLARVASFAAFESPPLYDLPKAERQLTRLRQERRKANAKTAEFQQLRLHFTKEMVSAVVAKTARVKAAT